MKWPPMRERPWLTAAAYLTPRPWMGMYNNRVPIPAAQQDKQGLDLPSHSTDSTCLDGWLEWFIPGQSGTRRQVCAGIRCTGIWSGDQYQMPIYGQVAGPICQYMVK
jgi:hypothetical protein